MAKMQPTSTLLISLITALIVALLVLSLMLHEAKADIIVYESPKSSSCRAWVEHLRPQGFIVMGRDVDDLAATKTALLVPAALGACHTAKG